MTPVSEYGLVCDLLGAHLAFLMTSGLLGFSLLRFGGLDLTFRSVECTSESNAALISSDLARRNGTMMKLTLTIVVSTGPYASF